MTYRPRIALDVQFGPGHVTRLRLCGFDVVVQADPGEMDAWWLERAYQENIDMVCSPDVDVEIWAYDHQIKFCKVPGHTSCDLVELVKQQWEEQR